MLGMKHRMDHFPGQIVVHFTDIDNSRSVPHLSDYVSRIIASIQIPATIKITFHCCKQLSFMSRRFLCEVLF